MLKILAKGPFVPIEIKRPKDYYDNAKKRKNLNNNNTFHSNISNKNTDFISTNNINNNNSNFTNYNNYKKYNYKDIKDDYLTEFIENVTKEKKQNIKKNNFDFTFQNKIVNNNNSLINNNNTNKYNNENINNNNNNNENEIKNKLNLIELKYLGNNSHLQNDLNDLDNNLINNKQEINSNTKLNIINNNKNIINQNNIISSYKDSFNYNYNYNNNNEDGLYDKENNQRIMNNIKQINKLKSLNTSLDNLYTTNSYLNKGKNKIRLNSSMDNYRKPYNNNKNKRIKSLSNKLKNIKNFEKYDTLINNTKIKKAGLQKSISSLENMIKIYNNNKKMKDKECIKILCDNKKIIMNNEINKEKVKDYYIVQNNIKENNKEYKAIKNQTNKINEEIFKLKNDIEEMNLNIKILNKKMMEDYKLCDKMRKDINIYKNHTKKLKQKLKLLDENTDAIEEVINQMNQKHI